MNLLYKLKSGWTTLKFLRVGLGSLILYTSIETGEIAGILIGSLFTVFSLFTDGVCAIGNTCYQPIKKNTDQNIDDIQYEELDTK